MKDSNDSQNLDLIDLVYNLTSKYCMEFNTTQDIKSILSLISLLYENKLKSKNLIENLEETNISSLENICAEFKSDCDINILKFLEDEIAKIDENTLIRNKNSNILKKK